MDPHPSQLSRKMTPSINWDCTFCNYLWHGNAFGLRLKGGTMVQQGHLARLLGGRRCHPWGNFLDNWGSDGWDAGLVFRHLPMGRTWSQHLMVQVAIHSSFRNCSPRQRRSRNNRRSAVSVCFTSLFSHPACTAGATRWVLLAPGTTDCSSMTSRLEIKGSSYRWLRKTTVGWCLGVLD